MNCHVILAYLHGNVSVLCRLDSDEVGALHYAARYNHQAVMQLLVDFNASKYSLSYFVTQHPPQIF